MFDPGSRWNEVGIHGLHQAREWDAVVSAEAPGLTGEEVHFVAAPEGVLIVDEDVPGGSLTPLAQAVEEAIDAPYRAHGIHRGAAVWTVGALRIDVVALPVSFPGEELELVAREGQRTLHVDGRPAFEIPPELEALAPGAGDYVIRARRLDHSVWEAEVDFL